MSFYETWVEQDLNPILSFSSQGKILYTNQEAQFLLNRIPSKELYDLALKHAPRSFGFETSYVDLHMKNYIFYAISIGYENEDEIYIKLYKSTMVKKEKKFSTKNITSTNIFTLVDLSISTKKTKSDIKYLKNYDPSIPEFKMLASDFIKLLNSVYASFDVKTQVITTTVKLKTGEYIRIEGKKHSIITVEILSDNNMNDFYGIKHDPDNSSMILTIQRDKVIIDLPLIL